MNPNDVLAKAETLRNNLSSGFRDEIAELSREFFDPDRQIVVRLGPEH